MFTVSGRIRGTGLFICAKIRQYQILLKCLHVSSYGCYLYIALVPAELRKKGSTCTLFFLLKIMKSVT